MPRRLIAPTYLIASVSVMAGIASYIKPSSCEPLYKRFNNTQLVCKNENLLDRFEPIPTHPDNTVYLKYFNYCINKFKNDNTNYTLVKKECNLYAMRYYLNDADPEFSKLMMYIRKLSK